MNRPMVLVVILPTVATAIDAFLWVADVDRLHDEMSARGAIVQLLPTDQSLGIRETGIRDPDGNVLVFAARHTDSREPTSPPYTS